MGDADIKAELNRLEQAKKKLDPKADQWAVESERRYQERVKAGTHRPQKKRKKIVTKET